LYYKCLFVHRYLHSIPTRRSSDLRKAKENEKFITLDEVERKLSEEDLVIADQEKPMCIAGVFGGAYSGVTEGTTAIFLESAYFEDRKSTRLNSSHVSISYAVFCLK